MKIEVDRRIYSDSCITKAIYSLSDKYTFLRKIVSDKEVIEIESCIQNQPIVESDILNEDELNNMQLIVDYYEKIGFTAAEHLLNLIDGTADTHRIEVSSEYIS